MMSGIASSTRGELTDHVAIVTGGGRGIGRAIAHALAAEGAAVAVVARSAEQVATTVTMLQALGARAIALPADVTDQHAVAWAVQETTRQLGAVDLLVNNAGSGRAIGPIWEVDPEMWWKDVTINLRGTFLCSRTVLPEMIARRRGRIINVASLFGIRSVPGVEPSPYGSGYSSSKAGILILTNTLATTTREYGISVFALSPGWVRTAMTEYSMDSEAGQKWLPEVRPLFNEGRDVPPERAARLAVFLASGKADSLSGRLIRVSDDVTEMVQRIEQIQRDDRYVLRFCE